MKIVQTVLEIVVYVQSVHVIGMEYASLNMVKLWKVVQMIVIHPPRMYATATAFVT